MVVVGSPILSDDDSLPITLTFEGGTHHKCNNVVLAMGTGIMELGEEVIAFRSS